MSLAPLPDPSRILAVIPARLASTRLPRKVLRELNGQPLLAWVVEAARRCPQIGRVVVAADSKEVAELCAIRGWECLMTLPDLPSGSDRLFAVSREIVDPVNALTRQLRPLGVPVIWVLHANTHNAGKSAAGAPPCSARGSHGPRACSVVSGRSCGSR